MKFYQGIIIANSAFFLEVLVKPGYVGLHNVGLKTVGFLQSLDGVLDIAKGYCLLYLLLDLFDLIRSDYPIAVLGSICNQLIDFDVYLGIS